MALVVCLKFIENITSIIVTYSSCLSSILDQNNRGGGEEAEHRWKEGDWAKGKKPAISFFMITVGIVPCSLANFYRQ